MESPRQQITDILAFVKSHQVAQQLEADSTTSPEPPSSTQQSTRSLTNSPPNSEQTTVASPMATDENAVLAAQLAATIPVLDQKEERPSLSYKDLIIEAIESCPEKRLKLSEIYQVIKHIHPYYKVGLFCCYICSYMSTTLKSSLNSNFRNDRINGVRWQ